MSASALLMMGVLMRSPVRDRSGLRARSALWRQFPAHEYPRADQKGDTDNRRRSKRGEILQHDGYLDPCAQSRSAAHRAGIARRPDTTGDVPAIRTLPAVWRPLTAGQCAASRPGTGPGTGRGTRRSPHRVKTFTGEAACACFPACSASRGLGRGTPLRRRRKNGATRRTPQALLVSR
jgi:hypothetical protein